MLAASRSRSNVPPDDLQTAPVIAFTAATANQLRASLANPGLQAYPADPPEQHAAGQKPGRVPVAERVKQQQFTTGRHAQTTAKRMAADHLYEFPGTQGQPAARSRNQYHRVKRHGEDQRDADGARTSAGQEHDTAQRGIRMEVG